jgi:hypothetical protein
MKAGQIGAPEAKMKKAGGSYGGK